MSMLLTGTGVMAAAAVLSVLGFLLVSRYVPARWVVADSNGAGALYATIGMVYAILIAIAAIAVWEPHTDAGASTDREAADMVEAYRSAGQLAEPDRTDIQALITRYTHEVVNREWDSLRDGRAADPRTAATFEALRVRVEKVEPVGERQQTYFQQLLGRVNDAADARRTRVAAADEGMPEPLWPILILGGLVTVGFLWMFGMERTFPNGLMMAVLGGMVALMLFVLYQVEYPFSHGMAVEPGAFEEAQRQLGQT
ncbi:bestrophin-like domain [Longispora urticae]